MVFVGLSLSAMLLRVNVWLLCSIGIFAHALMIPVTLLFPSSPISETLSSSQSHTCRTDSSPVLGYTSSESTSLLSCPFCSPRPSAVRTVLEALKSNHTHNIELFTSIIYTSPLSRFTIFAFFLLMVVDGIRMIFTQWASVTYHWIIADVQALDSFEMIVSGTLLLSLPLLTSTYLTPKLEWSSAVDMLVSKISLLFLFLGLGLMSIAPTRMTYILALTVFTLSVPLGDSLRSFSTGLIGDKEEMEKLYLGIGMLETVGGMIATAMWSGLFSNVLGKGWWLERTPFWGCLGIMALVWGVLRRLERFGVVGRRDMDGEAEGGEERV
jgi:hypothetical protein